jgi:diguanylate cyclase (GGDEF)-like protein/PAS domain S-box-containing protein
MSIFDFGANRLGRRTWTVLVAAILLAGIVILRFAVVSPTEAVLLLCVVPIALIALEFRTVGGIAAATLCFGIVMLHSAIAGQGLGFWGYVSRGAAFYFVGALIGRFVEEHAALERQHTRWFEVARDLSCTSGFDGYFKRVNPAWERVLGFSSQELMSRPFVDFVHPLDRERTVARYARLVDEKEAGTMSFVNRYLTKDGSFRWLEWTSQAVPDEQLVFASARDITQRKELEEELQRLAQHDSLTGLYNRRRFEEELDHHLDHVQRHGSGGAVFILDLDNFKSINDNYGHAAGDAALQIVAQVLTETLRGTDICGRLGGDEFGIILPETDAAGAEIVASKLVETVRERERNLASEAKPAASVGIAIYHAEPSLSRVDILAAADRAMYEAKRAGGDGYYLRTRSSFAS